MQANNWVRPRRADQIEPRPWLSEQAIEYFSNLLTKEMDVIEFGAGGSTLWLAERVKSVTSYENDADWIAVLRKNKPENVTLHFETFPTSGQRVDLIYIDGEPVAVRGEWLKMAPVMLKDGGIVVLDNANRPEYAEALAEFSQRAELLFESDKAPGTKYGLTRFYRLNA